LKREREVSNALSAYVNHDLRNKLINTGISISDLDNTDCDEKPSLDKKQQPAKKVKAIENRKILDTGVSIPDLDNTDGDEKPRTDKKQQLAKK
jgi:hypothetical protein